MGEEFILLVFFLGIGLTLLGFGLLIITIFLDIFSKESNKYKNLYKYELYSILIGVVMSIIGFGLCVSDFHGIN